MWDGKNSAIEDILVCTMPDTMIRPGKASWLLVHNELDGWEG